MRAANRAIGVYGCSTGESGTGDCRGDKYGADLGQVAVRVAHRVGNNPRS